MDFSKTNCKLMYSFYNYTKSKYLGIGNGKLSYKELLLATINMNNQYLPSTSTGNANTTVIFIGVINQNNTLIPGQVTELFYRNDQHAFDSGVPKDSVYYLSLDNTYGSPFGTPKKLVEDVE